VTIPAPAPRKRAPELGAGYSQSTRAWWRVVWASPMSALWQPSDVYLVRRLARLMEREASGEVFGAGVLAQMARLEDRLGLSPLGRRRLSWDVAAASSAQAAAPVQSGSGRKASDGRFLRAVKDGA
jgi:hypothetical protein